MRAVEDAANHNVIPRDSIEDDMLAVHELVCAAFVSETHAWIAADERKHGIKLAQILVGLSLAERGRVLRAA